MGGAGRMARPPSAWIFQNLRGLGAGVAEREVLPVLDAGDWTVEADGLVRPAGGDVGVVEPSIDVRIAEALGAEVLEHVPQHERRPALPGLVGMDGVIVEVPVAPLGHEPEAHVGKYCASLQHPEPFGLLGEEIAILLDLPLLTTSARGRAAPPRRARPRALIRSSRGSARTRRR